MFIHIIAPQFYLFQRGSNISRGGLPPHHCLCVLRATPVVILVSLEASVISGLLSPLYRALWAFAPVFYLQGLQYPPPSIPASLVSFRAPCHLGQSPIGIGFLHRSTPILHSPPSSCVALLFTPSGKLWAPCHLGQPPLFSILPLPPAAKGSLPFRSVPLVASSILPCLLLFFSTLVLGFLPFRSVPTARL